MISDGVKAWIREADQEQLITKAEEYAPGLNDKPRDVEMKAELRAAIKAELANRGFPLK